MIVVGVDENGLGPRLGPLVVTAVEAEADARGVSLATEPPKKSLAKRIGDSKALVSYGSSALGEAWARSLVPAAATPDALLNALCIDSRETLTRSCPSAHAAQCWRDDVAFASSEPQVAAAKRDLDHLAALGLRILGARVVVVCTRALNEAGARGQSRFSIDLHAMERLVLDVRSRRGEDVTAVCGKVGGLARYAPAFGPLSHHLVTALEEGAARSTYRVHGVGEVAFVRDADASSMLVGLASLIGKWVRDHLMTRISDWHRRDVPEAPDASGYYDPTTARFVEATRLSRARRELPDTCFERDRARRP